MIVLKRNLYDVAAVRPVIDPTTAPAAGFTVV
jgi:hypothetical protein